MCSLRGSTTNSAPGQLLHFADAAQVRLQLFTLAAQLDDFLLGQQVEARRLCSILSIWFRRSHTGADGAEVGEHAAQPTVVHIEHAAALGLGLDGLLGLLLGADEQDALALHGDVAHEVVGFVDLADGLLQVDDVDAVALGEDVLSHLGVPAAGLVAEVNAGLQQLLHGDDCHFVFPPLLFPPFASGRQPPGKSPAQAFAKQRCVIGQIIARCAAFGKARGNFFLQLFSLPGRR